VHLLGVDLELALQVPRDDIDQRYCLEHGERVAAAAQ